MSRLELDLGLADDDVVHGAMVIASLHKRPALDFRSLVRVLSDCLVLKDLTLLFFSTAEVFILFLELIVGVAWGGHLDLS